MANIELDQLIEYAANYENTNSASAFETLFETCFNFILNAATLPDTFPVYTVVSGELADALMKKGVYFALATKIETAWASTWSQFAGTKIIADFGSSSSSYSTSSSSSSSSSVASQAPTAAFDLNDSFGLFDNLNDPLGLYDDDLRSEWIEELPAPPDALSLLDTQQRQELLQAFQQQLRIAVDQVGATILDAQVPDPEAAKVYAELMFRQLHMLKQFIQAE